jgi:hypothetical protein
MLKTKQKSIRGKLSYTEMIEIHELQKQNTSAKQIAAIMNRSYKLICTYVKNPVEYCTNRSIAPLTTHCMEYTAPPTPEPSLPSSSLSTDTSSSSLNSNDFSPLTLREYHEFEFPPNQCCSPVPEMIASQPEATTPPPCDLLPSFEELTSFRRIKDFDRMRPVDIDRVALDEANSWFEEMLFVSQMRAIQRHSEMQRYEREEVWADIMDLASRDHFQF